MPLNKYRKNWKPQIQRMSKNRIPRQMVGDQLQTIQCCRLPRKNEELQQALRPNAYVGESWDKKLGNMCMA